MRQHADGIAGCPVFIAFPGKKAKRPRPPSGELTEAGYYIASRLSRDEMWELWKDSLAGRDLVEKPPIPDQVRDMLVVNHD